MTPDSALPTPPWPVKALPWPKLGTPAQAELESVWAVGPIDGPVMRLGSAADPRKKLASLARASDVPLVVHDIRWCRGNKGRALGRTLRKVVAGPIAVIEYRLLIEVEAARLGIVLADHGDLVAAVQADGQADLDEFIARCHAADDRYAMELNPDLSYRLREIDSSGRGIPPEP